MNLILVQQNSTEWNYMWDWLADNPINQSLENPSLAINDGEVWQYMGSYQQDTRVIHTFRHRNHPLVGYKTLSVIGSKEFTEDQIANKYRL